jgi:hypothetical protein
MNKKKPGFTLSQRKEQRRKNLATHKRWSGKCKECLRKVYSGR